MPLEYEKKKFKLPREFDKRFKLAEDEKDEIKRLFKAGRFSKKALAERFGVSRKLIQNITDPEAEELAKEQAKRKKVWRKYYDADKQREARARHRAHKKEVYNKLNKKEDE